MLRQAQRAVVVAMPTVRVVEMVPYEVIGVIAMGHPLVPAVPTVGVVPGVLAARVLRSAVRRVRTRRLDDTLVDMALMGVVEMALVQVIDVPGMGDGFVPASVAMLVIVLMVSGMCHGATPCGGDSPCRKTSQYGEQACGAIPLNGLLSHSRLFVRPLPGPGDGAQALVRYREPAFLAESIRPGVELGERVIDLREQRPLSLGYAQLLRPLGQALRRLFHLALPFPPAGAQRYPAAPATRGGVLPPACAEGCRAGFRPARSWLTRSAPSLHAE